MNEHLPECPVERMLRRGRTVGSQTCICGALRTCEERTTTAAIQRVEALQDFWRDAYFGTDHLVVGEFNDALAQAIAAIRGDRS